jgi:hypothetical protein
MDKEYISRNLHEAQSCLELAKKELSGGGFVIIIQAMIEDIEKMQKEITHKI